MPECVGGTCWGGVCGLSRGLFPPGSLAPAGSCGVSGHTGSEWTFCLTLVKAGCWYLTAGVILGHLQTGCQLGSSRRDCLKREGDQTRGKNVCGERTGEDKYSLWYIKHPKAVLQARCTWR